MLATFKDLSKTQHLLIGTGLFIVMFVVALRFGAKDVDILDVFFALFTDQDSEAVLVLRDIRIPREVGAIFVGAGMSVAGAIMQGMTRNPLADPGLLGLSAGAYLTLSLSVIFLPSASMLLTLMICFVGAALGALLVFGLTMTKKQPSVFRMVLAGASISTLLYAVSDGLGIYFNRSKDIASWTAGGLIGTQWTQLWTIAPFIILGISVAMLFAKQLTVLSLNEDVAIGLGQHVTRTKISLFIIVIILSGAAVALVGNMTFLGLMVPHIVRGFIGRDYRYILPFSALYGAIFMLFADTLGRTLNAPFETPVAAIIAIIGLPFFLIIVRRGGQGL